MELHCIIRTGLFRTRWTFLNYKITHGDYNYQGITYLFICGNRKEIQGQYGGDLIYDKYLRVAVDKSIHYV